MAARDNVGSTSLVGDGRSLRVACNRGRLVVVGNRADVLVERNDGEVRVVGNLGRVMVARNRGTVQYVGNSGCVRTRGGRVDYLGCDGHVERELPADAGCRPCARCLAVPALPQPPTPGDNSVVRATNRPDARMQFREARVRNTTTGTTTTTTTTISVSVSSTVECDQWGSRVTKSFWIAT